MIFSQLRDLQCLYEIYAFTVSFCMNDEKKFFSLYSGLPERGFRSLGLEEGGLEEGTKRDLDGRGWI